MKRRRLMRIVIAYDGSAGAELALEHLCRRRAGLPEMAKVRVLAVADQFTLIPEWTPGDLDGAPFQAQEIAEITRQSAAETRRRMKDTAEKAMRRLRKNLPHWSVEAKVCTGSAAQEMLAEAKE